MPAARAPHPDATVSGHLAISAPVGCRPVAVGPRLPASVRILRVPDRAARSLVVDSPVSGGRL